jgi:hypothetical protein
LDAFLHGVATLGDTMESKQLWKIIAGVLKLEKSSHEGWQQQRVLLTLANHLRDCDAIEDKVYARSPDIPPHGFQIPLEGVRQILRVCMMSLQQTWAQSKPVITDPRFVSMPAAWGGIIGDDEIVLESADLNELRDAINQARRAARDDDSIDEPFRAMLLDLIRLLDEVLDAYATGGMRDVQRATRAFFVASYAARAEVDKKANEKSPGAQAFLKTAKIFKTILQVAIQLDGLYNAGKDSAELLSWGYQKEVLMITHEVPERVPAEAHQEEGNASSDVSVQRAGPV